jgi:phosphatidylinositol alpha-1,6-mannosyltransferase
VNHLLVTNDFPPKVGGIQSYLWELWRRLPPDETTVLTTPHDDAAAFDAAQPFRIARTSDRVLLPRPGLIRTIDRLAAEVEAGLVLLDPALPLGLVGSSIDAPYGLVLHGAEVTVPGRLPGSRRALGRVLRGAGLVVAAGGYPAAEAERAARATLPTVVVPPGVDVDRFAPLDGQARRAARSALGLPLADTLILSVSRLVPRKGMDVLIEATASLAERRRRLHLAIAGDGRDRKRLERLALRTGAPVTFLGRVADADLPSLYASADLFAMLCRNRWAGLEQEGFGIVFLEAAAAGVPQVAGDSGGASEAVADGETGVVVHDPDNPEAVHHALARLVDHEELRVRMGTAARERAVTEFAYDVLAERLRSALDATGRGGGPPRDGDG